MNFLKGIFIGAGAILPGISSGVLCMVFGIYEKIINSILYFFKSVKENLKFLFPIAAGGIIGMILLSRFISYCFTVIPCQTKSLFIGLLLGSICSLSKENIKESHNRFSEYFVFIICLMIGLALIYLENMVHFSTQHIPNELSNSYLFISGFLMSIGIVVPGVSSTVILMLLGVYSTYLNAISTMNMSVLFPMIIGCGTGSILFMKLIQILLNQFRSQTIYGIVGFSLGSVLVLYPTYSWNIESFVGIVLLIMGFMIGKSIK